MVKALSKSQLVRLLAGLILTSLVAVVIFTKDATDKTAKTSFGPMECQRAMALAQARILAESKQKAAAQICLQNAYPTAHQNDEVWSLRARWLSQSGQPQQALELMKEGVQICTHCQQLRQQLADSLEARSLWTQAHPHREFLATHTPSPRSEHLLAVNLAMSGDETALVNLLANDKQSQQWPHQWKYLANGRGSPKADVAKDTSLDFELRRVDQAPEGVPATEPSIVASPDGRRVVVAWTDGRQGDEDLTRWKLFAALSTDFGNTWHEHPLPAGYENLYEFDPMTAYDLTSGQIAVGALVAGVDQSLTTSNIYHYLSRVSSSSFDGPFASAPVDQFADKGWSTYLPPVTPTSDVGELVYTLAKGIDGSPTIGRSADGGETFPSQQILTTQSMGSAHPRYHQGTFYVAFWDFSNNAALLRRSTDNGATYEQFSIAAYAGPLDAGEGIAGNFRVAVFAQIAVNPITGELYAVWNDIDLQPQGNSNYRIFFAASSDQGEQWTEPVIISGADTGDQFMPWIEVSGSGEIHVVYADTRHNTQADSSALALMDIYHTASRDGAGTWQELRVTPTSFSSAGGRFIGQDQFIGDYIGIAAGDQDVYLTFPYSQPGIDDFDLTVARRRLGLDVSGLWFNPDQSGHGFSFQHLESGQGEELLAAWFTYENGEPRWVLGQGRMDGNQVQLAAVDAAGPDAQFPPQFMANQANVLPWGTITVTFENEDAATVSWDNPQGNFGAADLQLRRLSFVDRTADGCLTGAWFEASNPGYGLFVEIVDDNEQPSVVVTWYAHHSGEQIWLQGIAPLVNREADLDMRLFAGGTRPQEFDAAAVTNQLWGQVQLVFDNNDEATFSWQPSLPGFTPGSAQLSRLSAIRGAACGG